MMLDFQLFRSIFPQSSIVQKTYILLYSVPTKDKTLKTRFTVSENIESKNTGKKGSSSLSFTLFGSPCMKHYKICSSILKSFLLLYDLNVLYKA